MNNLGKRLKERREQLKYSLKEVSVKTGITDSRLCRIENGQYPCQAGDLKQLGTLYNLPVISLFWMPVFWIRRTLKSISMYFPMYLN